MIIMWRFIFLSIIFILITGCGQKIPEPESFTAEASELGKKDSDIQVQHFVEGNRVKVECFVPEVSFNKADRNSAKINVYIDGEFHDEYDTAAFVIKNLEAGSHKMKIEVVGLNEQTFQLSKSFEVTIF